MKENVVVNRKAQLEPKQFIAFSVMLVFVIGLAVVVVQYVFSVSTDIGYNLESNTTQVLTDNSVNTQLYPVEERGVLSATVTTPNQTWLNFTGASTENITMPSPTLDFTIYKNFTVFVYVSTNNYSHVRQTLVNNIFNATSRTALQIFNYSVRYGMYNGSTYLSQSVGYYPNTTDKVKVAITYNSSANYLSNGTMFLINNNVYVNNNSVAPTSATGTNFYIGSRTDGLNTLNGSLFEFILFNRTMDLFEMQSVYEGMNYTFYRINETAFTFNGLTPLLINSTLLYYTNGSGAVYRSSDNGTSSTLVFAMNKTGRALWRSSSGTLYLPVTNTGKLYISKGNDTNWTSVSPYVCQNASGEGFGTSWYFDELEDGSIITGEYGGSSTGANCSYIHKSVNDGSNWSIIYNSTALGWEGKHIHFALHNPYNNYIYAAQGDYNYPSNIRSRFIRSKDNGNTWETLLSNTTLAQFISIAFVNDCLILGTDAFSSELRNAIYKTCDDTNFRPVYTMVSNSNAYVWSISRDNVSGKLVAGTFSSASDQWVGLFTSVDNGEHWYPIILQNATASDRGYKHLTSFDELGYAVYYEDATNKLRRFNILPYNNIPSIHLRLNENSGTTAYDSSGNGNNGTISGATWQTDGQTRTLTDDTDYNLSSSGMFSILNTNYVYSLLNITHFAYIDDSSSSNRSSNLILELTGVLVIIGVIVFILYHTKDNWEVFD